MNKLDLNGIWEFAFYEGKKLEELDLSAVKLDSVMVIPGCFDSMAHQYCQRGCAVYSRVFTLSEDYSSCYLRIDGMGLRSRYFVDGKVVGYCAMPYTKFDLDCGKLAAGEHRVTVLLDNNFDAEKMKLFLPNYDFYAFGGFYHGIALMTSKASNPLDRVFVRTVDYQSGKLNLEFVFKNAAPEKFKVKLSVNNETAQEYEVTNCSLDLVRSDLPLWSIESPAVHTLRVEIGSDVVTENFGIRQISIANEQILLNGKAIYLKGFNRHESAPVSGAATTPQQMLLDLQHLKSMHANFVRGSHYSQSGDFLDLCDRMGFLVWEESLGWGNSAKVMQDQDFIDLQIEQTRLMVRNSFNHPSVIIYGFLNENDSRSDESIDLCKKLYDTVKAENSDRLITFADCSKYQDRALQYMDILTVNTYPGWIQTATAVDPLDAIAPDLKGLLKHLRSTHGRGKPIIISEMGCCGIYGAHDEAAAQWTEEFQASYIARVIDTVFGSGDTAGLAIWHLNDAKSYHRTGSVIRVKPLAQNLAGVYDQYRRAKLAVQVVTDKFKRAEK